MVDMSPAAVAARLHRLRTLWTPMNRAEAQALLEAPRTIVPLTAAVVQRRLDELRALCDLAAYLEGTAVPHRGSRVGLPPI